MKKLESSNKIIRAGECGIRKFIQWISFRGIVCGGETHLQWKTEKKRGFPLIMVPLQPEVNWEGFQKPECVNECGQSCSKTKN